MVEVGGAAGPDAVYTLSGKEVGNVRDIKEICIIIFKKFSLQLCNNLQKLQKKS